MTELRANAHLTDDEISDVLDRLPENPVDPLGAHLSTCPSCADKLAQARTVMHLLRALPDVPLPRAFHLTEASVARPVVVPDPPNLVRLRGWYTAGRIISGSLAAVFIALVAATLYVDSRPVTLLSSPSVTSSRSGVAPAGGPQSATPARDGAPPISAAPASGQAQAPAAARAAAPAASRPIPADGDPTDQQAATTTVAPLPTPVATAAPLPTRSAVAAPAAIPTSTSPDAPWRFAAGICAALGLLALVGTLMLRRRIQQSHIPLPE